MKFHPLIQGIAGALGAMLILFVGLKARNLSQEYNYIGKAVRDRDVITITGTGKLSAKPDLAKIDLGVQTDAETVSQAQKENTEKMNQVLAAVKELGVASQDIQTTSYFIYPKQDYKDGKSKIYGYSVSQNVTIKVRNLDRVSAVLARAGELGANQVGGIQFTIDDPTSLKDDARARAIEDARKKAEALARQLGLTIVKVVTFTEQVGPQPFPILDRAAYAEGIGGGGPAPTVESGSLDVTSLVSVTFEVR